MNNKSNTGLERDLLIYYEQIHLAACPEHCDLCFRIKAIIMKSS